MDHYSVHKEVSGARTLSMLDTLQGESRIEEVAAMLAGSQYTETSLDSARELMRRAEAWKQDHRGGI